MDDFRDIDLALAVSDKDCKTLSHTGWQVKLDAIQSPGSVWSKFKNKSSATLRFTKAESSSQCSTLNEWR
jgi:hypothetical protein